MISKHNVGQNVFIAKHDLPKNCFSSNSINKPVECILNLVSYNGAKCIIEALQPTSYNIRQGFYPSDASHVVVDSMNVFLNVQECLEKIKNQKIIDYPSVGDIIVQTTWCPKQTTKNVNNWVSKPAFVSELHHMIVTEVTKTKLNFINPKTGEKGSCLYNNCIIISRIEN